MARDHANEREDEPESPWEEAEYPERESVSGGWVGSAVVTRGPDSPVAWEPRVDMEWRSGWQPGDPADWRHRRQLTLREACDLEQALRRAVERARAEVALLAMGEVAMPEVSPVDLLRTYRPYLAAWESYTGGEGEGDGG